MTPMIVTVNFREDDGNQQAQFHCKQVNLKFKHCWYFKMSSHLISESFGPDCQDVREKMLHNRKKEKSSEKERLNELCSRNAFLPANSAVFLGYAVICCVSTNYSPKFILNRRFMTSTNHKLIQQFVQFSYDGFAKGQQG